MLTTPRILRQPRRISTATRMPQTRSAIARASISHEERTATEPRNNALHSAILDEIFPVNDRVKKFRFNIRDNATFNFSPGQFLDVMIPGIANAGGFTITSCPRDALPQANPEHVPHFDLAIQRSPDNPAAAWFWQSEDRILGRELKVRVGGSFVWPPPGLDLKKIKRAVFIAGGVGINPLMSMLLYINGHYPNLEVRLLYSTKVPSRDTTPPQVLFLPEIRDLFRKPRNEKRKDRIELFFTGTWDGSDLDQNDGEPIQPLMSLTLPNLESDTEVPIVAWTHRIESIALSSAVGNKEEAQSSVFYICGPPDMTDSFVEIICEQEHVSPERVLCERWW